MHTYQIALKRWDTKKNAMVVIFSVTLGIIIGLYVSDIFHLFKLKKKKSSTSAKKKGVQ